MIKILIVDDHEIVRRGVKHLLSEEFPDAHFEEAANIPQARELIMQEKWDLVLLDINLPGGSGLDLLQEMSSAVTRAPVLVLSSYPEGEFAMRALKLGAAGFLTKMSVSDEMRLAVRKVMAGGKYVSISLAEQLAASIGNPEQLAHESLSLRELEVLQMVATGKTIKEVAADLSLSEKTIGTYRTRISKKLGLSTNVELARYALQHRLVE